MTFKTKIFPVLMAAMIILTASGCSNKEPQVTDSDIMGMDDVVQSGDDSESTPEDGESKESSAPAVPLDIIEITPGEARELLKPNDEGIVAIESPKQLAALAALVNSGDMEYKDNTYVLQNNINLYGYDFTPIGGFNEDYVGYMFDAVFDGGDFIISGLTVRDCYFEEGTGLFGVIGPGGEVKNIHVTSGNIIGKYNTGGIAGRSVGTMTNCSFRGTVYTEYEGAGGLVGSIDFMDAGSNVTACFANAEVSGNKYVGTFAGEINFGGSVRDCYALGSVISIKGADGGDGGMVGGFIGSNSNAEIIRCYSNAEVYTKVSSSLVGGFTGFSDGLLENCYYNFTPTSNWKPVGNLTEDDAEIGVTPCETLELCESDTFEDWDFTTVWDISETQNRGLPFLR